MMINPLLFQPQRLRRQLKRCPICKKYFYVRVGGRRYQGRHQIKYCSDRCRHVVEQARSRVSYYTKKREAANDQAR